MSAFTNPVRHRPWLTQITLLSVALGALLALSLKTQDRIRQEKLPNMRVNQLASSYADLRDTNLDLTKKVADMQGRLTQYQKAAADESGNAKLLSADLQKANVLAGLVAVNGPGVEVILRDSKKAPPKAADMSQEMYLEIIRPYLIHDQDIQAIINELRAAGAEAIAINDQRVVTTTAIRCVGPTVVVNNVPTSTPVHIKAIGDPDTMMSSLSMAGGVTDAYKLTDASMIKMDKAQGITIPAFSGATPLRFAQAASDAKAEQSRRDSEQAAKSAPNLKGADTPPSREGAAKP